MPKQVIMRAAARAAADRLRMSPAILSNGHVFFTGVTGADSAGHMPADPAAQIEAVFAKIGTVLAEAGIGFDHIVEMTSYHVGIRDHFDLFDAIRLRHFKAPYPAWTAIEAGGLRREGAIVEVKVIAALEQNGGG